MNFKCKMCGGELNIDEVNKVATCKYCGSKQSLVRLVNAKAIALYEKANSYLVHNEFDKASAILEELIIDYSTEADLYWSIILAKYGVKYVDDPKTHKKIPTMNRVHFTSIFDDENYKYAIQYATDKQKEIFTSEAKRLNDIQKEILEISKNEDPYDIFICYKETDEKGRRTIDSVIAQDIYQLLDKKGYKVFFARISLEDKLGIAYEPYIFRALNSARIMLVVGTTKEHVEAVWVENEWSRYLNLMKEDDSRLLIPVIKDMSPYDLPKSFNHLEALDLTNKLDLDDLLQVVQKRLGLREEKASQSEAKKEDIVRVDVSDLIVKAKKLIEEQDFVNADKVLEAALNKNPMEMEIYLLKLLAENKAREIKELGLTGNDFSKSYNYKMILKSENNDLIASLEQELERVKHYKKINEPNKEARYLKAGNIFRTQFDPYEYYLARKELVALGEYKLSVSLVEKIDREFINHGFDPKTYYSTLEKIKLNNYSNLTQQGRYDIAKEILSTPYDKRCYFVARNFLISIGEYKDRDSLLAYCDSIISKNNNSPSDSAGYTINITNAVQTKSGNSGKIIGLVVLSLIVPFFWIFTIIYLVYVALEDNK